MFDYRKLPQQISIEKKVNSALRRLMLINDEQIRLQSRHANPYNMKQDKTPHVRCSRLNYLIDWSGQLIWVTNRERRPTEKCSRQQLCKRNKGDDIPVNNFHNFGIKIEHTAKKLYAELKPIFMSPNEIVVSIDSSDMDKFFENPDLTKDKTNDIENYIPPNAPISFESFNSESEESEAIEMVIDKMGDRALDTISTQITDEEISAREDESAHNYSIKHFGKQPKSLEIVVDKMVASALQQISNNVAENATGETEEKCVSTYSYICQLKDPSYSTMTETLTMDYTDNISELHVDHANVLHEVKALTLLKFDSFENTVSQQNHTKDVEYDDEKDNIDNSENIVMLFSDTTEIEDDESSYYELYDCIEKDESPEIGIFISANDCTYSVILRSNV